MSIYTREQVQLSFEKMREKLSQLVNSSTVLLNKHIGSELQLLSKFRPQTELDKIVYELMLDYILRAELAGPGSVKQIFHKCESQASWADQPQLTQIEKLVNQQCEQHPKIRSLLLEAINLAGFCGKIFVEKNEVSLTHSVEVVSGNVFEIKPLFGWNEKFIEPFVLCIDGFIESVGEVDLILSKMAELNEPLLLFVRGLADDVQSTLKGNFEKKKLKIIPVIVPYDLTTVNTLVDIASIFGTDVVSSLKGELISSIDTDKLVRIKSASVYPSRIVLHGSKVNTLTKNIQQKIRSIDENKQGFYTNRLKSSIPRHVIIRLPNDVNFVKNAQVIDQTLRSLASLVRFGSSNNGNELAATEIAASVFWKKLKELIDDLGAVIT